MIITMITTKMQKTTTMMIITMITTKMQKTTTMMIITMITTKMQKTTTMMIITMITTKMQKTTTMMIITMITTKMQKTTTMMMNNNDNDKDAKVYNENTVNKQERKLLLTTCFERAYDQGDYLSTGEIVDCANNYNS